MNKTISQHVHIIENQRISATLLTSSNSSTTRCSFGWLEGCTPCCALFLHTPDLLTVQGTKITVSRYVGKKIDWKQWYFEGIPISSQDGNILNPDDFPLFNQLIFRFHVNFLGCIRGIQQNSWRIIGVWTERFKLVQFVLSLVVSWFGFWLLIVIVLGRYCHAMSINMI